MKKILSLLLLFSSSILVEQVAQAHGGGAVAGGVFGGLALGSIIASSNRQPRETVIYERQPVPVYVSEGDDGFYYDQYGNQVPGPRRRVQRRTERREQRRHDDRSNRTAKQRRIQQLEQELQAEQEALAELEAAG